MSEVQKIIGESAIGSTSQKKLKLHIADGAVTQNKLSDSVKNQLNKIEDLQNQIDSHAEYGVFVSNEFGNLRNVAISQKTLTDAINNIWSKLEDITGESLRGISMGVIPEYFYGDEAVVHITATPKDAPGIFEHIAFYANGELIAEGENVEIPVEYNYTVTETTTIKCVAKILGLDEYIKEKTITKYNSFWLGSGSEENPTSIVTPEHAIQGELKGSYDIVIGAAPNNHIIIVTDEGAATAFVRADMNGFEIPFREEDIEVEGNTYKAFISENAYIEGSYNIDINS